MADVHTSGPLFDGRAIAEAGRLEEDIVRDVAAQGYSNVMTTLNASIRHPTPYYETQITVDQHGNTARVHDRGIVYGPWLETGYHGSRPTRFRGYHSFLRATEKLRGQVKGLAERLVAEYVRRIG